MCICLENKIQYKNFHPSTIDYTPSIHVWYIYLYIYHKSQPFMLVNIPFVPWIRHGYNPTVQVHRGIWLADLAALRKGKAGHSSFKGSIFDLNWPEFLEFFWPWNSRIFDLDFSKASHFWGPGGIRPKKVAIHLNFEAREKSEAEGIRFQMLSRKMFKNLVCFFVKGGVKW